MWVIGETVIDVGVQYLLAIAAVCGALLVIGGFSLKAWRLIRKRQQRWDDFFEDWSGVPDRDGVPGRLGVMARLQKGDLDREVITISQERLVTAQESTDRAVREIATNQRAMKDRVDYEMSTNGGGSLRDEVRTLGVEMKKTKDAVLETQDEAKTAVAEAKTAVTEAKKVQDVLSTHIESLSKEEKQ